MKLTPFFTLLGVLCALATQATDSASVQDQKRYLNQADFIKSSLAEQDAEIRPAVVADLKRYYNVDWSKLPFIISYRYLHYEQNGPLPYQVLEKRSPGVSRTETLYYFNCFPTPYNVPITTKKVESKETDTHNKQTNSSTQTASVSLKGTAAFGEANAVLSQMISSYTENELTTKHTISVEEDRTEPRYVPSNGELIETYGTPESLSSYLVTAQLVSDATIVAVYQGGYLYKYEVGLWSQYIPADKRSVFQQARVVVSDVDTVAGRTFKTFPDQAACETAEANAIAPAAQGTTPSGLQQTAQAAPNADRPATHSECSGTVTGRGEVEDKKVKVTFTTNVPNCSGKSAGKIRFRLLGRDSELREMIVPNYVSRWSQRSGEQFDVLDVVDKPDTLAELVSIDGAEIIECNCDTSQ